MASKQVQDLLVRLKIDGLEGLDSLKGAFRELAKTIGPTEQTIEKARQSIVEFGKAGNRSEQIIRGQLEAFRGLKSQAEINGSTFVKLTEDIKKLELELSGSTAAINKQREAILRSTAASDGNVDALRKQADALSKLQRQTRPGSAAFIQLGKDIEKVDQKLVKVRSEAQAFALALNQIPAASVEKQVRQIETLRRTMNTLKITSDEYLDTLQRINLVSAVQATTTGRQQVRAANQMFESSLFERFVGSRAEALPLPATTAGLQQRILEINQELANVTGYERRRALTIELIDLNRQLKKAVIDITTTEELAAMATRQRASAAREILSRSGFGAFSADVRARAAGGAYDPGTQKAMERARNRIVDQEAVQAIEELYGRWEQAYSEIEGLFERHQVTKAEIAAKGVRAQNEILDRQHDQSLKDQQRRFEEELALFDQSLRQRDQLLQRRTAVKGMLGLEGRELSPLYQGIVDIGTRRAAAGQARMGRTPQQALADIVNVFNSDLDRAGNGFLESERQLREAAIEFAGGSRKVREKFEQIALGKTPAGMFPAPGEDPAAYRQRIEAPAAGLREIIENFRKKTDRAGDGFLEAEKKLRQAAIDFAENSEEVKRAFARVPLGKTPTSMLPASGEVPSEYISRIRGGFEDVRLPDFASFRKGTTRELQLVRQSLQELRLDLNPLAAGFEMTEKRIVRSIRNIDKELERRQIGGRRMTGMQVAQAAGAAVSGGIFGGPEGFLGGALGGVFGGVGGAFVGAAAGAQLGGLRQQLGGFADYAAQIQKMQIALENAAGSQAQFNQAMAAADAATRNLNVPQDVAIQGMTRLTAAVKGAGGQVSDAEIVFNNVTSAIKATGGSAQDVDGAITAMVQVFSKGKVSAEELSGQLGERLPGAVTKFAKANNMSLPELQKALEQGEVGLNELMNFIIQLGGEYSGVAQKIAASSQDAGARLTVAFNEMKIAVGEALQPIGAQFQEAFIPFIENITPALVNLLPKIGEFALSVAKNLDVLAAAAGGAALAMGALSIASIKVAGTAGLSLLGVAMMKAASAAGALTVALKASSVAALLNPWVALAAGIAAATVALIKHNQAQQEYNNLLDNGAGSTDELRLKQQELESQISAARKALEGSADGMGATGRRAMQLKMKIAELESQLARINKTFTIRLKLEKEGFSFDEEGMMKEFTVAGIVYGGPKGARAVPLRRVDGSPLDGVTDFQSPTSDEKKSGKSAADKAAKEEERIQARIRSLRMEAQATLQIAALRGRIAEAEIIGDQESVARLRGIEREQQILVRYQQEIANVTDERLRKAIEGKALADLEMAGMETAIDMEKQRLAVIKEQNNEIFKRAGLTPSDKMRKGAGEFDPSLPDLRVSPGEQQMAKYREELEALTSPINAAVTGANAIGDAFGQAFQSVMTGAESAQKALSDAFKAIGEAFIQMAAEIIAKQIAMIAFQALLRAFGGASSFGFSGPGPAQLPGGAGFAQGFSMPSILGSANGNAFAENGIQPFARGGIVTRPTFFKYAKGGEMQNGLMGEAGPEAIMPLKRGADGKLGVAAKLDGAMGRYRRSPGSAGGPAGGGATAEMAAGGVATMEPIDVRYSVERINNVDYVTADQFQRGMAQAARQGAIQGERSAMRTLGSSPAARRRLGI